MSTASVKSTFMSIGELDVTIPPSSLLLKLTVNHRAVRYYIQTLTHDQFVRFGKHTLHHVETTEDLAQRLERIVEKDELLQLAFAKIVVGVDPDYTLVPREWSAPDGISEISALGETEMNMVYKIDSVLKWKIQHLFKSADVVHLNSSLSSILPSYLNEETNDKLFVNVEQDYMDIIRYGADNQLQLMNRYAFRHENDFIYYLLLCCEQLKIDRQTTELVLLGEVDIQSQIYSLCYRYFRNLNFIQPPSQISFTKAFDLYPKHFHFNLYNLNA